jgi:hypothetical protein
MSGNGRRVPKGLARWISVLAIGLTAIVSVVGNTRFDAPPRYDGAGYAMLGRSLAGGRGYRQASHPDAPPHTHYPPGYPLVLALVFRAEGRSNAAAHRFSVVCTVGAVVLTWAWYRRLYRPEIATLLGLALAVNWTWGRIGGAIQSEPLYLLLSALALVVASRPRRGGIGFGMVLGLVLGACTLTRHVGACLALAIVAELAWRREFRAAAAAVVCAGLCVVPWASWLAWAGRGSQAGLFQAEALGPLLAHQTLFYTRRIPDQFFGPFVELSTVYAGKPRVAALATAGAVVATGLMVLGWCRALRSRRRRLASLVAAATIGLLLCWPFTEAGRFLIPLVPVLAVGAVEGASPLLCRLGVRRSRRWAAGLLIAASLPYSAYALATGRARAQERSHLDFDRACAWIARQARTPGVVLTHFPADVFWQTGRKALGAQSGDPRGVNALIDHYGVAYLLIDEHPFTNAPADPLARFVAAAPDRVRLVWGRRGAVGVYEVVRPPETQGSPGARPRLSSEAETSSRADSPPALNDLGGRSSRLCIALQLGEVQAFDQGGVAPRDPGGAQLDGNLLGLGQSGFESVEEQGKRVRPTAAELGRFRLADDLQQAVEEAALTGRECRFPQLRLEPRPLALRLLPRGLPGQLLRSTREDIGLELLGLFRTRVAADENSIGGRPVHGRLRQESLPLPDERVLQEQGRRDPFGLPPFDSLRDPEVG